MAAGIKHKRLIISIALSLGAHAAVVFYLNELPYSAPVPPHTALEVNLSLAQIPAAKDDTSKIIPPPQPHTPETADQQKNQGIAASTPQAKNKNYMLRKKFQQVLAKLLDVDPVVTGSCILIEAANGINHRLKCNSSALYEVLYKNQQNIAEMLIDLRQTNQAANGFSAELVNQKLTVQIIMEEPVSTKLNQ